MMCLDDETLSMLADNALDENEAAALKTHLSVCPSCAARLREMRAASAALRRAYMEFTPSDAPRRRALASIRRRAVLKRLAFAAAAAVLLAAATGVWLARDPGVGSVPPVAAPGPAAPPATPAAAVSARASAQMPDWLAAPPPHESYAEFMARIESRREPALDMDTRFSIERASRPAPALPPSGGNA